MSETVLGCIGGRDQKLVEARFLGTLGPAERTRLEAHLSACAACTERYRRLQLAERVAARPVAPPEEAVFEPSPAELERIAADLGLSSPPIAPSRIRLWIWGSGLAAVTAAFLATMLMLRVPDRQPDGVTEEAPMVRGGGLNKLSFSAYLIGADGAIHIHVPSTPVSTQAHLKLRTSGAGEGPIHVLLVPALGPAFEVTLSAPAAEGSVPGAISLAKLPAGHTLVYLIAGPIDQARALDAVADRPSVEKLRAELGDAAVSASMERLELEMVVP